MTKIYITEDPNPDGFRPVDFDGFPGENRRETIITMDEMEADTPPIPTATIVIEEISNNCIVYIEPRTICVFEPVMTTRVYPTFPAVYEVNTNDICEVNAFILANYIENIIENLIENIIENLIENIIEDWDRDHLPVFNRKTICIIIIIVLSSSGLFIAGFYVILHK